MKPQSRHAIFILPIILMLSLGCDLLSGGQVSIPTKIQEEPLPTTAPALPEQSVPTDKPGTTTESEFPVPAGAQNIMNISGTTNYQVSLTLNEVMGFYREKLTALGLTEEKMLTVTSETTFSMVFKGAADGKSVVVQGVDLGNGTTNVNIRYEKV